MVWNYLRSTYVECLPASKNILEANKRAALLYRKILRLQPHICQLNELTNFSTTKAKRTIRSHFDQHRKVTDPAVADRLQHEAAQRLSNAMYAYASPDYQRNFLDPPGPPEQLQLAPGSEFLRRFYEGSLGEAPQPTVGFRESKSIEE
eukprot:180742_1